MLKTVLTLSAIYLAIVGLALMFAPLQFGIGAVPPDASSELIALLRLLGGPFLGIAVLNWMTRNAEPSATRDTVALANMVGFGAVAANDVWSVFSGEAREIAKVFLAVHLLFTAAFVASLRRCNRCTAHTCGLRHDLAEDLRAAVAAAVSTNTISLVWQARGPGDEPRVWRAPISSS